jgi:hypothetical protein
MSKKRLYILVLCLSMAGYSWISWNVDEVRTNDTLAGSCLFRSVTGIPCPSCGTTHSVVSILHGEFRAAIKENPLGFLVALMLSIFPCWIAVDLFSGGRSFFDFYLKTEIFLRKKWVAYPAIILLLINWFLNIHKSL